jgi:hypothetical protein
MLDSSLGSSYLSELDTALQNPVTVFEAEAQEKSLESFLAN